MPKIIFKIIITFFIIIISNSNLLSEAQPLVKWEEFSKSKNAKELISWLKEKAYCSLHPICQEEHKYKNETPEFYGKYGIFITLVKNKKVRGCYGSFYHPSYKINDVLDDYLQGALRHDSRYSPLKVDEVKDARIIVTIATKPIPIFDLDEVNLKSFGILVHLEDGGRIVFIPSEIKKLSHLKKRLKGKKIKSFFKFKTMMIE